MFSVLLSSLLFIQPWWGAAESTKEPLKVLTSRRLPQLMLVTYHYYYTAWCLTEKTILRLWLGQTERRTESEGKEWVLMFPGGVKTENERGETEEWAALWGTSQILLCLSFCSMYSPSTWRMDAHAQVLTRARTLGSMRKFSQLTGKKGCCQREKWVVRTCDCVGSWNSTQQANKQWYSSFRVCVRIYSMYCKSVCDYISVCLTGSPLRPAEPSLPCSPRGPGSPWQEKEQMYKAKGISDNNNRQVKQTGPHFKLSYISRSTWGIAS